MWSKGTLCTDAEAETPVLWPPDVKNWLIEKDPHAGKDWRQEEKGTTENEMVGWYHWLMDMSFTKFWELVMDREAWHAAVPGVTKGQTRLSDWIELNLSAGAEKWHTTELRSNYTCAWNKSHFKTLLVFSAKMLFQVSFDKILNEGLHTFANKCTDKSNKWHDYLLSTQM